MGEVGVLTEDDRVELLEGWIVQKMVHNPRHDGTIDIVHEIVRELLPRGWLVRIQSSVTTDDSEPEPDLAIVKGQSASYISRHPGPKDIGLVVEVADSSLEQDRELKARIYARAKIRVNWIINIAERKVEVYELPSGPVEAPAYRSQRTYGLTEAVPLVLGGKKLGPVAVRRLFP